MQVWDVIKGVRFRQLKCLLLFLFKHPFFLISTVKATFDVLRIASEISYNFLHSAAVGLQILYKSLQIY